MNCSRFETLLSDYVDGTLDPRVRAALEQHREICSSCTSLVQEVQSIRAQLADFPTLEPSEQLIEAIIEKTTGRFRVRSLWDDLIVPTLRPFLTQRFAFATLIMFVFLSLVANVIGPDFSALSFSDFRPSALVEQADRFSSQVQKAWFQVRNTQSRIVGEVWRLKEDLYGRLDYHLINMLFRSYQHSVEEQGAKKQAKGDKKR
ncbi:MAG: anti-sigma factor [Acidobacteriota bacterium]